MPSSARSTAFRRVVLVLVTVSSLLGLSACATYKQDVTAATYVSDIMGASGDQEYPLIANLGTVTGTGGSLHGEVDGVFFFVGSVSGSVDGNFAPMSSVRCAIQGDKGTRIIDIPLSIITWNQVVGTTSYTVKFDLSKAESEELYKIGDPAKESIWDDHVDSHEVIQEKVDAIKKFQAPLEVLMRQYVRATITLSPEIFSTQVTPLLITTNK